MMANPVYNVYNIMWGTVVMFGRQFLKPGQSVGYKSCSRLTVLDPTNPVNKDLHGFMDLKWVYRRRRCWFRFTGDVQVLLGKWKSQSVVRTRALTRYNNRSSSRTMVPPTQTVRCYLIGKHYNKGDANVLKHKFAYPNVYNVLSIRTQVVKLISSTTAH